MSLSMAKQLRTYIQDLLQRERRPRFRQERKQTVSKLFVRALCAVRRRLCGGGVKVTGIFAQTLLLSLVMFDQVH